MAEMSKTTLEPGCYFDAAFGFDFNAHRILEFALSLGFEAEEEDLEEEDVIRGSFGSPHTPLRIAATRGFRRVVFLLLEARGGAQGV